MAYAEHGNDTVDDGCIATAMLLASTAFIAVIAAFRVSAITPGQAQTAERHAGGDSVNVQRFQRRHSDCHHSRGRSEITIRSRSHRTAVDDLFIT